MIRFLNPNNIHQPLASYVHQCQISGNTRWLVLSGQLGMDGNNNVPDDPIDQFNYAFQNITINLQAANMQISDIVKMVIYCVGDIDTVKRREVIQKFLGSHKPCMTMLFVAALANPKFKIEIDVWACKND